MMEFPRSRAALVQIVLLLFHNTHQRVVSGPASMAAMHLEGFDGVLAFGEVVRDACIRRAAYDALLLGSILSTRDGQGSLLPTPRRSRRSRIIEEKNSEFTCFALKVSLP
jgi:hypothetical protein